MTTAAHDFLSTLAADDIAALEQLGTTRAFARGQTLFHESQLPDRVLVVRADVVKVTSTTPTGREVVLAFRGMGELVGEPAALDGEPRSATIRAIELVSALALPLSQEELAGSTGASIESVGRALHTMRTLKCIETRRREISILDLGRVAALCAEQ